MKLNNKSLIILLSLGIWQVSLSQTVITVKKDGTGDYTTVQEGINAASNGDTVLIYPGRYYENVWYDSTSITIASLALITGDPQYISQTIIDGNRQGRCMSILLCDSGSTFYGLSFKNGKAFSEGASSGAGLSIFLSKVDIINCVIDSNLSITNGGGIWSWKSEIFLSGVTIKNNHAVHGGGGMSVTLGNIAFDSVNRCNIYLNYAAEGTDIVKGGDSSMHVIVDTFTVLNPDYYYLQHTLGSVIHDGITFDINAGKLQTVNQDLYVSNDGSNSNSGLSPDEPLKNLWYALLKMESDSLEPDTIHIANGLYTISAGEKFPLSLKAYVSLKGQSRNHTILDGEDETYFMYGIVKADHYQISKLTLQHGNGNSQIAGGNRIGVGDTYFNRYSSFDSLLIRENKGDYLGMNINTCNGFVLNNVEFRDNIGGKPLWISNVDVQFMHSDTTIVNSCIFQNNIPNYFAEVNGNGGGVRAIGQNNVPKFNNVYIYNSLFIENHSKTHPNGGPSTNALSTAFNSNTHVINCTFGNNTSDNAIGANKGVTYKSDLRIYNSILYNNYPAEIYMYNESDSSELSIYHSLVHGGEDGIRIYTGNNSLYYDPSNIDTDPIWDTASMYPYSLSAGSPCINTGTLDLPPGVELPDTDLAGNPRVYDGYVDMGAYEYGPWVGIQDPESRIQNPELMQVWPNPFRFETNISYTVPEKGRTVIRVYDLNGRCVKTLMNVNGQAGQGQIQWRGLNDQGTFLQAGTYIIGISINGKERDAVKVVKR